MPLWTIVHVVLRGPRSSSELSRVTHDPAPTVSSTYILNTHPLLWGHVVKHNVSFMARTKKALLLPLLFTVWLSGLFSTWGMLSYPWVMSTSCPPEQIILISHNLFISFGSAWFHRHCLKAISNYFYIFPFYDLALRDSKQFFDLWNWKAYSQAGNSDGGEVWFTLEKESHPRTSSYGYWIMHFLSHFNRKPYPVMYIWGWWKTQAPKFPRGQRTVPIDFL